MKKSILAAVMFMLFGSLLTSLLICLFRPSVPLPGTFSNSINIVLMIILVATTIFYAKETARMATIMQQTNQLNFRPYIQISGYPPEMLSRMEVKTDAKQPPPQFLYAPGERSFGTGLDPQGNEYIFYSLHNIGNVPARNIIHKLNVFEQSEKTNQQREISIPSLLVTEREVIFPKSESQRSAPLGKQVAYRTTSDQLFIDIVIQVLYQGDTELDSNTYFTMKKLRFPVLPAPDGNAQISVVDQDAGIIR